MREPDAGDNRGSDGWREVDRADSMSRLKPTTDVIRGLFARSGNQCAFPGCGHALVNEKNKFIGQICHIEAASFGGPRYNPSKTDEQRRSYENLMILCYAHHIETNDEDEWTSDKLRAMKRNHENQCEQSAFEVNESTLREIAVEMDDYWNRIHRLNKLEHVAPPDVAVEIDSNASFGELMDSCNSTLRSLCYHHDSLRGSDERLLDDFRSLLKTKGINPSIFDGIPYYENPFNLRRNWETHFIAVPNLVQRLQIDFLHMEIKYLEECLKATGSKKEIRDRLDRLRAQLAKMAQSSVSVD